MGKRVNVKAIIAKEKRKSNQRYMSKARGEYLVMGKRYTKGQTKLTRKF